METQENSSVLNAQTVFSEHLHSLYRITRFFLLENETLELLGDISQKLEYEFIRTGFKKYSHLLAYQLTFKGLKEKFKSSHTQLLGLDFEQFFCLLLRDGFHFDPKEISAILGISSGSVLTRLEKSRIKAFGEPGGKPFSNKHQCILYREKIELENTTISDCPLCNEAQNLKLKSKEHFQAIANQSTPDSIKNYLDKPFFRKEGKKISLNWASAPWYLKVFFEGFLATTLVLGIVLSIPRIKSLYEFWQERRLDLYNMAEVATTFGVTSEVQKEENVTSTSTTSNTSAQTEEDGIEGTVPDIKSETEFVGRGSEAASSDKIYRILIKSDSPESIKGQVVRILSSHQYSAEDPETLNGLELPGGVMFDVFVPLKMYDTTKRELGRLGETKVIITRAKQRGVPGKVHLKIWLQRI